MFCAGADLDDPPGTTPGERFGLPGVLRSIVECPKPVIARVNGHVRAGGLGLVAACDIAVAPFDATFAFTEVRLGLVPAIVAVFCQPLMQPRAFAHYTLTGVPFDAAEAARARPGDPGRRSHDASRPTIADDPRPAAARRARRRGPHQGACSASYRRSTSTERLALTSSITATQFQSDDAVEGIAAFRDKRLPAWARPRGDDVARSVRIREVGVRDGLQSEAPLLVEQRVALIESLLAAGVTHLEVAAFVSPNAVPSMAGAAEVVAAVGRAAGGRACCARSQPTRCGPRRGVRRRRADRHDLGLGRRTTSATCT